ncbi:mitochondrial substrate carrier family protein [Corchorus olitorius]|uniref:Mitochondrial substrate carrier family protein n=1 Tax=Corchorus olitorius TaxID=93759 RepID=A0A1R3HCQ2_9ROSI|nr:mitochondrial substrate carrier family protein [Corchorus olitorius]
MVKNHLFATHAIAASGSIVFGTALTYPLHTMKTLIQVGSGSCSSKQLTSSQVIIVFDFCQDIQLIRSMIDEEDSEGEEFHSSKLKR